MRYGFPLDKDSIVDLLPAIAGTTDDYRKSGSTQRIAPVGSPFTRAASALTTCMLLTPR